MLDRQHGDIIFECDRCMEVLETGTGNFDAALNFMKQQGWRSVPDPKEKGEWNHFCGGCK